MNNQDNIQENPEIQNYNQDTGDVSLQETNPDITQQQESTSIQEQHHVQEDAIMEDTEEGDQEALLRKEVQESAKERFKRDNAPQRIRNPRKRRHEDALEDLKAYLATQQALNPTPNREVVPRNMPGLQVLGGPQRFDDRDMHESIAAFFTAFEAQLHSHRLDLDQHWERLFWQCIDNHQRAWFQRTLYDHNLTWQEAQQEIEKEYGNPCHIWQKGQELYELRQTPHQSIREYVEEFESLAREAARVEDDRLCKDFIYSLDEEVRVKLYPVLASTYPQRDPTNLREVALLAIRTLGEHMESTSTNTSGRSNKRQRSIGNNNNKPNKSRRKYGNCPVHKHGSHDKEQCDVLRRIRDAKQQPNTGYMAATTSSSRNSGTASCTNTNICKHCRKVQFTFEHLKVCPDYQAKRQGKNDIHNRSITVTNTGSSRSRADEIYDFCAGQLANMDITCNYTCYSLQDNTSNSLLVALTVQTENILALVDTGANRSFITPSLANTINTAVNKDILDRTHVSLAQNGSSATLLGLAQNVSITVAKSSHMISS